MIENGGDIFKPDQIQETPMENSSLHLNPRGRQRLSNALRPGHVGIRLQVPHHASTTAWRSIFAAGFSLRSSTRTPNWLMAPAYLPSSTFNSIAIAKAAVQRGSSTRDTSFDYNGDRPVTRDARSACLDENSISSGGIDPGNAQPSGRSRTTAASLLAHTTVVDKMACVQHSAQPGRLDRSFDKNSR